MQSSPPVGSLAATSTTGADPRFYEVVPVRPNGQDPSWPPVLIVGVAIVVLGGLLAAAIVLRRAWNSAHPTREPLDG